MAKYHILRIGDDGNPVSLYEFDAQNKTCTTSDIQQWSEPQLKSMSLMLLVPATWVYHSRTQVASKNMELLAKSIPFAIEEELSNEVEDNYFAFQLQADGSQDVVAIEKSHLDQINQAVKQHQLSVTTIHSEVDWLPAQDQTITIWRDPTSSLMRFGSQQAMRVANHQVNQLLPVFGQGMQQINVNQTFDATVDNLPIHVQLDAASCCEHLIAKDPIDLFVDELKVEKTEGDAKPWRVPMVLTFALLISWAVIQGIQAFSLKASIDVIKQEQSDLFKSKYNNAAATELLDPYAAMQSRLKIQSDAASTGQDVLLDAVEYLGQAISQQQLIQLNGLRLVDQKMEIQIMAPNIAVINAFHQSLQQRAFDYQVQIGVNELGDDNTFKSILTMVPR